MTFKIETLENVMAPGIIKSFLKGVWDGFWGK